MFNNAFQKLNKKGRELKDDEYISNGVIFCKKCKTPRQFNVNEELTVDIPCDCQNAEIKKADNILQKEERQKELQKIREIAIPVRSYWNYKFENDDSKTPDITRICKRYVAKFNEVKDRGQGLLFYGDVGTGKTFYSMCIANALIDNGYNIQHISLAAVVQLAQDFENAQNNFKKLMNKQCVIIDDLGTERTTAFAQEQIFKYIDGWNTCNTPLIITTNRTLKELEDASNDITDLNYARIYSKILEKCYPIKVNQIKRRNQNKNVNRQETMDILGLKDK